jgi:hypothetical protein
MVQGCLSGLLRSLTLVIRSVNVARAREGQQASEDRQRGVPFRDTSRRGLYTRGRAWSEAGRT